jgi:hypothetical protein
MDPAGGGTRSERFYARNPYDHDITTRIVAAGPVTLPVSLSPAPLGEWFVLSAGSEVLLTAQLTIQETNALGRVTLVQEWLDQNLPRPLGGLAFDVVPRLEPPPSGAVCVDFSTFAPGDYPQPLRLGDLTLRVDRGFPDAPARVFPGAGGGRNALDSGFETVIEFPRPCRAVWLEVIPDGSAMDAQALNATDEAVASAGPVGPAPGERRTLELRAAGIVRAHLKAPLDQCLIERICYEE